MPNALLRLALAGAAAAALTACGATAPAPLPDRTPRAGPEAAPWTRPVDLVAADLDALRDPASPGFYAAAIAAHGRIRELAWRWRGWEHAARVDARGDAVEHDLRPGPSRERGGSRTVRWERDPDGRVLARVETTFRGDAVDARVYADDGAGGRLVTRSRTGPGRGPSLRYDYAYDDAGRLATVTTCLVDDGAAAVQDVAHYRYDDAGRPVAVDGAGAATLRWDDRGRLLALETELGRRWELRWSAAGTLAELVYEDRFSAPRPARASVRFDPRGLPEQLTEAGGPGASCAFRRDDGVVVGALCASGEELSVGYEVLPPE